MRVALGSMVVCAGLIGCSVTEKQYGAEYCSAMNAYLGGPCDGFADWASAPCGPEDTLKRPSDCVFDRNNAKSCLEEMWGCDSETGEITLPLACADVYICMEE